MAQNYGSMSMPTSAQALQQLQDFQAGAQTPDQLLSGAKQSLGVGAAQQQVQGLRGAIQNTTNLLQQVAPGVMGRTQGSLVTSAQANRQIQNESAPIQQTLSKQNTDYGNANQDYTDLEKQAEDQANMGLQGQQNQISYLKSIYDAAYGQEKDASDRAFQQQQLAEQVREANQKSASSGSGGLDLSGLMGGATAAAPAQQGATKADAQALVKSARQALGGGVQSWGKVAKYIEDNVLGGKISTGSYIDQVLHGIYG